MKLCIDCKHCETPLGRVHPICSREKICLVTGEKRERSPSCDYERYEGECGTGALYWEARDNEHTCEHCGGQLYQNIDTGDVWCMSCGAKATKKGCPMPSHHNSCDCNGEGGDR